MSELVRYDGRTVVVTGCASGMGEATARLLRELGATVVGVDIRAPADDVVDRFERIDLRDEASIAAVAEALPGEAHALFNCAGLPNTFPPLEVFTVNFLGLRTLTDALVGRMPEGSAIVSIASIGGRGYAHRFDAIAEVLTRAAARDAAAWCEAHSDALGDGYDFSKECLIVWTMHRARELAATGIRINCVSPGLTETPMLPHFEESTGRERLQAVKEHAIPLRRFSRPEEQAAALAFLGSEAASYITGTNLIADGGTLATFEAAPLNLSS